MHVGVADNAGCLVAAIKVNLIAPYPGMVSKCLLLVVLSDSVSHTHP
jgi:hypothetical protein